VARLLIEAQADPHARDRFGGAPLDDAVRHGHSELQVLLRGQGAVLSGSSYAYKMCDAAERGDLDTIETLIVNGVDPAVRDRKSLSPHLFPFVQICILSVQMLLLSGYVFGQFL
jgi:ankyrin repeat protein